MIQRRHYGFDANKNASGDAILGAGRVTIDPEKDAAYVNLCKRQGGYPRSVVTHGKTWWQNGAGEAWNGGLW